jgi:hypothetical protein
MGNAVGVIGAFLSGLILIAALSLIVAPSSSFGAAVKALGQAVSDDISAAKS